MSTHRKSDWRCAAMLAVALSLLPCCERPATKAHSSVARAQFGIFYGGQVQERDEIPFVIDRARQQQGIRLEFASPLQRPTSVKWELDMPGTSRRVRDARDRLGQGRLLKLGQATVQAGRSRFDQLIEFAPGDSVGTWNIRVMVDQELVIDRPFLVYDVAARRRAQQDAGGE